MLGYGGSPGLGNSRNRTLGALKQRAAYLGGKLDHEEEFGGIQIIFPAFIHDPNVTVSDRVLVRKHTVDLVQLQRRRIIAVVDAYSEEGFVSDGIAHDSVQVALPFDFLATDDVEIHRCSLSDL
jgi:hypothetical protein